MAVIAKTDLCCCSLRRSPQGPLLHNCTLSIIRVPYLSSTFFKPTSQGRLQLVIDTLVAVIGDRNSGKSNQIRSIFEEPPLTTFFGGYPPSPNIQRTYLVDPDIELYVRLSSWHERGENWSQIKNDLQTAQTTPRRRFKAIVPLQVSATQSLSAGEKVISRLISSFNIRRTYAVWLDPAVSGQRNFAFSSSFLSILSTDRSISTLSINSAALHPSANPAQNAINARLLVDLLLRT